MHATTTRPIVGLRRNTELLESCPCDLTGLDAYYRPIVAAALEPMPCPSCARPVSPLEAAPVNGDLDRFIVTWPGHRGQYACPGCGSPLHHVMALGAGLADAWVLDRWTPARGNR